MATFKKIFLQTIVSASLSFLTFAIGFIRVYFFSKSLSMEEFGVFSLLLTLSAFLLYILTFGSYQYVFTNVSKSFEDRQSALFSSIVVTLLISILCILISFLFIDQIGAIMNLVDYKTEIQLTILATILTSIMTVFLFYHYGLGRNNFQNFLQFLRGSLWVIASLVISVCFKLTLTYILIVMNICMFFILLVSIPWNEPKLIINFNFSLIKVFKVIKYCFPLLPYFAGVWGIPMIIRTQLNVYEGAQHVAVFSVAYTLMEMIFMFTSTISATLSPYFFAEQTDEKSSKVYYNISLKYSLIIVLLILPFIFISRYDLIELVASSKYLVAGDYIAWLILLPVVRTLIVILEQYYLKESKTLFLGIIYSISMLISFMLSIFFVSHYSVIGGILTSLASYFFILFCLYFQQKQLLDFNYLKIYPLIIFIIIIWASVFLLGYFSFNGFIKTIPLSIIAILSLFLLPIFSLEEKKNILSIIKRKK